MEKPVEKLRRRGEHGEAEYDGADDDGVVHRRSPSRGSLLALRDEISDLDCKLHMRCASARG